MYKFIFTLFVFTSFALNGQTRLIAHKSHSGTSSNFLYAMQNGFSDHDLPSFGAAPERTVTSSQLDSVIYISDTVAVMVTSEYCVNQFALKSYGGSSKWKAGKDTVFNHPLFTMKHNLDSIKKELRKSYYFTNSMDSVRFIGYDNEKVNIQQRHKNKKNQLFPGASPDHGNGPFDRSVLPFLGLILLVSVTAGCFSWKFIKP